MILLLALVVLGPERLPEAIRRVGRVYTELKRMSSGLEHEIRSVIDEPMNEIRSSLKSIDPGSPTTEGTPSSEDADSQGEPKSPDQDAEPDES